jgi:hypothetical protein
VPISIKKMSSVLVTLYCNYDGYQQLIVFISNVCMYLY